MSKKLKKEKAALKTLYFKIYSEKNILSKVPKLSTANKISVASELATELEFYKNALIITPQDSAVLLKLKSALASFRAFGIRCKRSKSYRKNKPMELREFLNSHLLQDCVDFIVNIEIKQYEMFFEENPIFIRPDITAVLNTKSVGKRILNENLLDICRTLYIAENIRVKIEQNLLENPKELYPAARAMHRRFIIHTGTTNTGKTHNALQALEKAQMGAYLGPLRLLAMEVQEKLLMSNVMCNMKTGEEERIVPYATHISSTVELANLYTLYDVAVIDECQMIADKFRGSSWTRAILGMRAAEIHLCTAPEAVDILIKIIEDCGDEYQIISYKRKTPLVYNQSLKTSYELSWLNEDGSFKKTPCSERLKMIKTDKLRYGDALIAFSSKDVLKIASILREQGIKSSVIYGALPYNTRKKQLEQFINKETKVVVATDAIGMGINIPIKRVIFTALHKYDGYQTRILTPAEIKQIAGRAGRYGIYNKGYVFSICSSQYVSDSLDAQVEPIEKAYIDFDTSFVDFDYGLEEILEAWKAANLPFDIYCKINLDRTIKLIRRIDKLCAEKELSCTKDIAYKLATVVFDEGEPKLIGKWIDYVELHLRNSDKIPFPDMDFSSLEKLEISFKKVELYYVFCHDMGYAIDAEQVDNAKKIITEEINILLNKQN